MKALMAGVPFAAIVTATTSTAEGTPFAVPFRTHPIINLFVQPTGSVSAFSYDIKGSTDGVTYATMFAAVTTQALLLALREQLAVPIIRIDQVSRTGGTTQTVYATLSQM